MKNDKSPTVAEGLGIDEEWSIINNYRALKSIEDSQEMSEAIIKIIHSVKNESFGETDGKISDYEKKLVLTGMHLGENAIMKIMTGWGNALTELSGDKLDNIE